MSERCHCFLLSDYLQLPARVHYEVTGGCVTMETTLRYYSRVKVSNMAAIYRRLLPTGSECRIVVVYPNWNRNMSS